MNERKQTTANFQGPESYKPKTAKGDLHEYRQGKLIQENQFINLHIKRRW